MPVTIAPGSGSRLRRRSTGFVVLVAAGTPREPAVLDAVRRAFGDVRTWLLELDDPDSDLGLGLGLGPEDRNEIAHVSSVMPTPTGAAIYVDGGDVSPSLLVEVLDRAVEDLHRNDVADAVVSVPRPSPVFDQLVGQPCGPRLSLVSLPPVSALDPWAAPPSWADRATEWLLEDPVLVAQGLRALVSSQEFSIGPADIPTVLDLEHAGRIGARTVLAGDPATGVRSATYQSASSGVLTLGSSGSASAAADRVRRLTAVAESEAAGLDYAWLELPGAYPLWFDVGDALGLATGDTGRPPRPDHMPVMDEVALDAFPFQVLGPGHLHRLGGWPGARDRRRALWPLPRRRDVLPETRPLADGRLACRLGSTAEWADERRAAQLRRAGRRLLAPILPDRGALHELGVARLHAELAERRRLRDRA